MASTFTANINLEEPARGDQVGTWDTPVNSNMTILDLVTGGRAVISGAAGNVTLAAAQFQANTITFNSTLLASITVTFPTSFHKTWQIQNACTGSSAFTVTLQTTTAAATAICAPPGEIVTISNFDGFNMSYVDLGRIGTYWDYCGSSVPNWVSGCTVPPYLNCDGSAIPAAYTLLPSILGSSLLPDARGRSRFALAQGTTRLTSAVAGFSPTTVGAAGGDQLLHAHNHVATDSGHTHGIGLFNPVAAGNTVTGTNGGSLGLTATTNGGIANITVANSTQGGGAQNIPPAYMGGLTLIRAA